MSIDAEVVSAGIRIGNVLVTVLEQQGPPLTEHVTRAETDFEIEIEGLADDARVDVGGSQAGPGLGVRDEAPAGLDEIVTRPERHAGDVTPRPIDNAAPKAFAQQFKITAPPSIAPGLAQHVTELGFANGIVDGGPAVVGKKR